MFNTEISPKDKLLEQLENIAVSVNSDGNSIAGLMKNPLVEVNPIINAKLRVAFHFMFETEKLISEALTLIVESK